MKMKYGLRALGISLFFFLHLAAFAEGPVRPTIRRFEVNGLPVFLINTHVGNVVNLSVDVKVGSWHDEPLRHAGRAHMWEHQGHAGSRRFPGQSTFDNMTTAMGAETNAYTSHNRTFYHGSLHPEGLREWAELLGAMLSEPEWNEKTFRKELKAVKDEAAANQEKDDRALKGSILLHLLPPGHPLAMYDIGSQAQLDELTLRDLQMLFYTDYNDKTMSVILSGNFDALPDGTVPLVEADVLEIIKENFKLPVPDPSLHLPASVPSQNKVFPSIVDATNPPGTRLIEIGALGEVRSLQLNFEMVPGFAKNHHGAMETMTDYLNLDAPGALKDLLLKKGWISSFGVYPSSVNNLTLMHVDFELTEEGARHRYEVADLFFATLHDMKTNGLRPDILEYLKMRNIRSYEQSVFEAGTASERLAEAFEYVSDPLKAFDFEAIYGHVTAKQIKKAVTSTFRLPKMIGGYVGPEINDVATTERAQVFDRPLVHVQDEIIMARWQGLLDRGGSPGEAVDVKLVKVPLEFSDAPLSAPSQLPRVLNLNMKGVSAALDEQHLQNSGGVQIMLTLPPVSLSTAAAMELYLESFNDRYKSELDYLTSMGVPTKVSYGNGNLKISSRGNSKATLVAKQWILERLLSFVPTQAEVEQAREVIDADFQQNQQDFSARIARHVATSLVERYNYLDANLVKRIKLLDNATVKQLASSALNRADIIAAFAGDYTEQTVKDALLEIRGAIPQPLQSAQRKRRARTSLSLLNSTQFWQDLPPKNDGDHIGIARIFQGPSFERDNLREHAAIDVLSLVLNREVYQLNRADRGLGYVHGSGYFMTRTGTHMSFVGQTIGMTRFPEIEQGWGEVLGRLQNGTLSSDGYRSEARGASRLARLLPTHFGGVASRLLTSFYYTGNPRWHEIQTAAIPTLTGAEIDEVGRRYLLNVNHVSVIASNNKPDCEGLMVSETLARRNIERAAK